MSNLALISQSVQRRCKMGVSSSDSVSQRALNRYLDSARKRGNEHIIAEAKTVGCSKPCSIAGTISMHIASMRDSA